MKPALTRPAAISLLIRVMDNRQTLDEALAQDEMYNSLEGSNRGLARAIASAALRYLGQLDMLIAGHITGRPYGEIEPTVRQVLRVGAAQICVLKTPVHAAVSETVEAARRFEASQRAGGLINAVLRKLTETSLEDMNLSAGTVWPEQFEDMMREALGDHAEAIAAAMLSPPPLDLTLPKDRALFAEALEAEPLGPVSLRLEAGQVESLPGYEDGKWWVQDVAATLPVHFLNPVEGESILDLCAAPGGKTLQIATTGAHTTAIDRSAKRLQTVKNNLARTGLSADCYAADATKWESDALFDGVLIDAPCSALGTLRRHPEGPWIKLPEDMDRFPSIQARLLVSASRRVKPDGRMIYCVCTPLPREGVEIVNGFLNHFPDWERVPVTPEEAGDFAPAITLDGDVLTLPPLLADKGGCDVFYIARLKRRKPQP